MKRGRKLALVLVPVVVASLSIGVSLSGTAAAARSGHGTGSIIYRGKSAPLRQIAQRDRATTLVRPTQAVAGLGGRVQPTSIISRR